MYIEFKLPQLATTWVNQSLDQALHTWSDKYQIPYNTKIVKYTKRITFNNDKHYEFFALTWIPITNHSFWTNYRIIRDLNNKL